MDTNNENNNNQNSNVEEESEHLYTKEEVDRLLQAETDRRVNSALEKQAKKNADKLKEAEKLAKMSSDEKYLYELEQREAAIAEKERQLAMSENKNEASKILADKGLSLSLVDFVVDESADIMADRIKLLEKAFKASVKAEVEKRLGGRAPQASMVETGTITKESFAKLSMSERQKLYLEDKELYNSLTGK